MVRLAREHRVNFRTEISVRDEVVIIHCGGRIVYREEAEALCAKLAEIIPQANHVVIDLSDVEMMDSAGLGKLIGGFISARNRGGVIKLAAPTEHVRNLLELTRLSSVFEIYVALDEAVLASREALA